MPMVEMKRMMNMRDYCVFVAFFPNRLFVTVQKSKEHGHDLWVVKKFPVTRLQRLPAESRALMNERARSATPQDTRDAPPVQNVVPVAPALFGAMANVGILEQIWRVKPIWSTTRILIRIFETWLLYALMYALSRVHPGYKKPYLGLDGVVGLDRVLHPGQRPYRRHSPPTQ